MRRVGRIRGWVYAHERVVVDPMMEPRPSDGAVVAAAGLGKRRVVHEITEQANNGGFVRSSRKPTNHSKYTGKNPYREEIKKTKGGNKFKHDEYKTYYHEGADNGVALDFE